MKRAKKRPLPSTRRQYEADNGPLTDAQHAAIRSAVQKAHGRAKRDGKEGLFAEIAEGFETLADERTVGKDIR